MEEQPVEKKVLFISPAVQVLIVDTPEAGALLERLKKEQGYDIVEYDTDKPGAIIGHIVAHNSATAVPLDYTIYNADGIIQVLSKILSPEKSNAAEHSPPVSFAPSYQGGGRELMRESDDGVSMDDEVPVVLTGLKPESKSFFAKWCSCFPCFREPDQEPLLSTAPRASLK